MIGDDGGLLNVEGNRSYAELVKSCEAEDLGWNVPTTCNEWLAKLATEADYVAAGTEAIYRYVYIMTKGKIKAKEQMPAEVIKVQLKEAFHVLGPSTQVNPAKFDKTMNDVVDSVPETVDKLNDIAEALKFVQKSARRSGEDALEEMDSARLNFNKVFEDPGFTAYYVYGLFVFVGLGEQTGTILLMARGHMNALFQTISSLASTLEYFHIRYKNNRYVLEKALEMVDLVINRAFRARGESAYKVAQALHKLYTLEEMRILGQRAVGAVDSLNRDYTSSELNDIVNADNYRGIMSGLMSRPAMEVGKIYKILPAPDFCPAAGLAAEKANSDSMNPMGDEAVDGGDAIVQELIAEIRRGAIRVHHSSTGKMPEPPLDAGEKVWDDYEAGRFTFISDELAMRWPLKGIFHWYSHGEDYNALVKDKTLPPDRLHTYSVPGGVEKMPMKEKSMILRMMFDKTRYDTRKVSAAMPRTEEYADPLVQIAWKPESHKPASRLFFMAPMARRLINSELEENIAKLGRMKRGFVQGKNPVELEKTIHRITNANIEITAAIQRDTVGKITTPVVISYDLESFSPRFPAKLRKISLEQFAEFFDKPELVNYIGLTEGVSVCTSKEGFVGKYENKVGDFQGFHGKLNTWLHCDVMSLAYRRAARDGLMLLPAELLVQIDDGIGKVEMVVDDPFDYKHVTSKIATLKEHVENTYAAIGWKIHKQKTIWSTTGGTFLHEVYAKGVHCTPGNKAYIKIAPDFLSPVQSLPENLSELFAKAQGSLNTGNLPSIALYRYVKECVKAVYRWTGYANSAFANMRSRAGVFIFTPRELGGLGVATLQMLEMSVGANHFSEGLAVLRTYARRYKTPVKFVTAITTQTMLRPSKLSAFRTPLRIVKAGPILRENTATAFLIDWVKDNRSDLNPELAELLDLDLRSHAESVFDSMTSQGVMNVALMTEAWNITPLAYVESIFGKFKRATTLLGVVKRDVIRAISAAQRKNVNDVVREFMTKFTE